MLYIKEGENSHYLWIKDFLRFCGTVKGNSSFNCQYCFSHFWSKEKLETHKADCQDHDSQTIKMPQEKVQMPAKGGSIKGKKDKEVRATNIRKFTDYAKTIELPYYIAADFETFNSKVAEPDWEKVRVCVQKIVKQISDGFAKGEYRTPTNEEYRTMVEEEMAIDLFGHEEKIKEMVLEAVGKRRRFYRQ